GMVRVLLVYRARQCLVRGGHLAHGTPREVDQALRVPVRELRLVEAGPRRMPGVGRTGGIAPTDTRGARRRRDAAEAARPAPHTVPDADEAAGPAIQRQPYLEQDVRVARRPDHARDS